MMGWENHRLDKAIWIDDVREMPAGYDFWLRSVREATEFLLAETEMCHNGGRTLLLDMDHDAGEFQKDGGDYIRLLDWIESTGFVEKNPQLRLVFRIHSANPAGRENMARILRRNGWETIGQISAERNLWRDDRETT